MFLKRPLQELQREFDTQRTGRYKISRPIQIPDDSDVNDFVPAPAQAAPHSFAAAKLSLDEQLDALIDRELLSAMQVSTPPNQPTAQKKPAASLTASTTFELTASTPPMTASPQRAGNGHFHVGAGVKIPDNGLSLTADDQSAVTMPAAKPVVKNDGPRDAVTSFAAKHALPGIELKHGNAQKPAVPKSAPAPAPATAPQAKAATPPPTPVKAAPVAAPQLSGWREDNSGDDGLSLEITQTIRPLSQQELDDPHIAKWFVVQLAISDHPVNLDAMPKLDIFDAYALYCVAVLENGGIRYALRLGFFSEEVSAHAVMGYLRTFFGAPSIERISKAEHTRFTNVPKKIVAEPNTVAAKPTEVKSVEAKPTAQKTRAEVLALDPKRPVPASAPAERKVESKPVNKPATTSARPASSPTKPNFAPMPPPRSLAPSPEVSMPAIKPMVTTRVTGKYAAPAMRHARSGNTNVPLTNPNTRPNTKPNAATNSQGDLLDGATLLGLSDSQIMRVKGNPSLLSRLVDKLTR